MHRKHQLTFVFVTLLVALLRDTQEVSAGQFGSFEGRVAVEWLSETKLSIVT